LLADPIGEVEYDITEDDLAECWDFLRSTPDGLRVMRIHYWAGAAVGIFVSVLALLYSFAALRDPVVASATFVALSLTWAVAWHVRCRSMFRRTSAQLLNPRRRSALGRHRMAVDECGVHEVGPKREVRHRWSQVGGIYETRELLILPVGLDGEYIVPKRAFADPAAADKFRWSVERLRRAARAWDGPPCAK